MPTPRKAKELKAVPVPISVSVKHKQMLEDIKKIRSWGTSEIYAKALELFHAKFLEDQVRIAKEREEFLRNDKKE